MKNPQNGHLFRKEKFFVPPQMRFRALFLTLFFALAALEGSIALAALFQDPSMERNALLFGFSAPRLTIGGAVTLAVLFFIILAVRTARSQSWTERFIVSLDQKFLQEGQLALVLALLAYSVFIITLVLLTIRTPLALHLGMLVVVIQRLELPLLWVCLLAFQSIFLLVFYYPNQVRTLGSNSPQTREQIAKAILILTLVIGIISVLMTEVFKTKIYSTLSVLLVIAVGLQLLRIFNHTSWSHKFDVALNAASVFLFVTILYRQTTMYVGMLSTPDKSYFDRLAEAWLNGRLYLTDLNSTHDLTLFNGNWYVANPPLVAILMLPFVALFGLPALNTVVFSILFAALNVALIYILLELITARGWVQLRRHDSLWLTALFAFGTAHWYLGVIGKMWFMSQVTTLTFLALAVLLAVMRKSPLLQGIALGLAMLARPHILVFAPLLLGIAVQNSRDDDKPFRFGDLFFWGLTIGLPVVVAGAGLLFYNWLRFGNIFDYGYLTENVADFMAEDLKNYGTFHPHFILRNLRVMFLSLPKWSEYCRSYLPSVQGLSIFIVTPALVFLAGSLRRTPWILGAWGSIVATIIPLALYYNTGAWQFGYKYILDFIIPVILLLAVAAGNRMTWVMRLLILISIAMNAYGVLWWFGVTVCRG